MFAVAAHAVPQTFRFDQRHGQHSAFGSMPLPSRRPAALRFDLKDCRIVADFVGVVLARAEESAATAEPDGCRRPRPFPPRTTGAESITHRPRQPVPFLCCRHAVPDPDRRRSRSGDPPDRRRSPCHRWLGIRRAAENIISARSPAGASRSVTRRRHLRPRTDRRCARFQFHDRLPNRCGTASGRRDGPRSVS